MTGRTSVFGLLTTITQLKEVVADLKAAGFRQDDISVLFADRSGSRNLSVEKHTKAAEGAAAGAGTGAILGGALGWLVGIGVLAIPGLGAFIAAGPIMGALAGAGAGGTVLGLTGAMVGLGTPEFEAKRYEGMVTNGGILVSVHADSSEWARRAEDILDHGNAADVSRASEAPGEMTGA
jgi:hypothetical protein